MSDQQVKLLQEYVLCLEKENETKNKERQALYAEMEQLRNALKAIQSELMRVKMSQSVVCSQQQAEPLKQKISELESDVQMLKYEQQHLFEENLSLISALEGTAQQNTELQQQNAYLKSQKEELEKFRKAIERISANLQEFEAERIQLTEANLILVEENSYLKGVLAASRSSYNAFQQSSMASSHQNKITQKNFYSHNPAIIKSSYLMSSSFEKISENEQEYEATSTQGGGSTKRNRIIGGSTGKKKISSPLMERQKEVQYNDGDDFIVESADKNINNFSNADDQNGNANNNEDSSYLMMMSKEESLRGSWDVQRESLERDNQFVGQEGLRISNFERALQKQNRKSEQLTKNIEDEARINILSEKHSPQGGKNNSDESSCEVVQQELPLSEPSHYQQKDINNHSVNISANQERSSLMPESTQQQFQDLTNERVQELLTINSELQQQVMQLNQKLIQTQNQRQNLFEQLYKRQEQERENFNEWEAKMNEMTNNYNIVLQHVEQLQEENIIHKNRIAQLQEIIKSYNRKNSRLNSSLHQQYRMQNDMVCGRQNRFSYNYCDNRSPYMSRGQGHNRALSIASMEELRQQVDPNMNQMMQKVNKKSKGRLPDSYQSDYNKQNDMHSTNQLPFEGSFTKACKKFNHRSSQKLLNESSTEDDHCYPDDQQQNSEIRQVENRLQRRIERIKSQNQILLKELQLF